MEDGDMEAVAQEGPVPLSSCATSSEKTWTGSLLAAVFCGKSAEQAPPAAHQGPIEEWELVSRA